MTDQQQPKEYITTEENICEGCGMCKRDGYQDDCCIIARLRPRPHPAPARSGCGGCRKETEHLECPMPGHCDQMKCPICCEGSDFPTLPEEIKKYEAEAARKAREQVLKTFTKLWRDNYCPEPKKACHADDGKDYCPICILKESLRTGTPQSEQEQPR